MKNSALKSYLEKYKGNAETPSDFKITKKKKKPKKSGIVIIDDEIDTTFVKKEIDNDLFDEDPENRPTIVDEKEANKFFAHERRMALLNKKRDDSSSGWKVITEGSESRRHDSPSPKRIHDDLSPPRRRRHDSDDDLSPPRNRKIENVHGQPGDDDLSPPRRKSRTDDDLSPPRRRHDSDIDLSPKRRRHDSDDDLSPKRRRRRHDSPDKSPIRRSTRHDSDDDLSPVRRTSPHKEAIVVKKSTGLRTAEQVEKDLKEQKIHQDLLFSKMDPKLSGQHSDVVYRDKSGKQISKEEYERMKEKEKKKKVQTIKVTQDELMWGKGLVQREQEKSLQSRIESAKTEAFSRYEDDEELDAMYRNQIREGDPMAKYIMEEEMRKQSKKKKKKKSKQKYERPMYKGPFPPNRFGIRPGWRWDGIDRSNGYENELLKAMRKKEAMEVEAYHWRAADM